MTRRRHLLRVVPLALALAPLLARTARAQGSDSAQPRQTTGTTLRTVSGKILLGKRSGERPLAGLWVVLHRVDPERGAASSKSGPVDSVRTARDGAYTFRFRAENSEDLIYFVLASYGGIAYPLPVRDTTVVSPDADIVVFDTTSATIPLPVRGRHVILFGPREDTNRLVGEVFEISNDSTVTVVSGGTRPVWSVPLPSGVIDARLNPEGDIPESSAAVRPDRVDIFAPISPGVRQISFTYAVPADRFPLVLRFDRPAELLEVLVQEPGATLSGANLQEVAPIPWQGQMFRRFLAQDVAGDAVITITAPRIGMSVDHRVIIGITSVLGIAMLAALWVGRRRRVVIPGARLDPAAVLLRDLAALDARFESLDTPTDQQRDEYARDRARLKERLQTLGPGALGVA